MKATAVSRSGHVIAGSVLRSASEFKKTVVVVTTVNRSTCVPNAKHPKQLGRVPVERLDSKAERGRLCSPN